MKKISFARIIKLNKKSVYLKRYDKVGKFSIKPNANIQLLDFIKFQYVKKNGKKRVVKYKILSRSALNIEKLNSELNHIKLLKGDLSFSNFLKVEKIVDSIRRFFKKRKFNEVFTPIAVHKPAMETNIESVPCEYKNSKCKEPFYLITSPEYSIKKLMCAGFERVFELTRGFRNSEVSNQHNIEFTILEWYRMFSNYLQIMKDTENLVYYVNKRLNKKDEIVYNGNRVNLKPPFDRLTVSEAFFKYANIDLMDVYKNQDRIKEILDSKGLTYENDVDFEDFFFKIMVTEIEPNLGFGKPLFLYDYPLPFGCLSKRKKSNPDICERFELYICSVELANAYSELIDYKEQEQRFIEDQKTIKSYGRDYKVDYDLLDALKIGFPETGGIALGVDRLIMILTNETEIENVITFPTRQLYNKLNSF